MHTQITVKYYFDMYEMKIELETIYSKQVTHEETFIGFATWVAIDCPELMKTTHRSDRPRDVLYSIDGKKC